MNIPWGSGHPHFEATLQLDHDLIHYPWNAQQWLETVEPRYAVFHWESEAQLQGFALYQLSELEKLAHLLKIAVIPAVRGKGVAQQFWDSQVATLRARGFERVFLEVATNNSAALGFYRKIGFRMLREVKGFYRDGQSAWTMELAI